MALGQAPQLIIEKHLWRWLTFWDYRLPAKACKWNILYLSFLLGASRPFPLLFADSMQSFEGYESDQEIASPTGNVKRCHREVDVNIVVDIECLNHFLSFLFFFFFCFLKLCLLLIFCLSGVVCMHSTCSLFWYLCLLFLLAILYSAVSS